MVSMRAHTIEVRKCCSSAQLSQTVPYPAPADRPDFEVVLQGSSGGASGRGEGCKVRVRAAAAAKAAHLSCALLPAARSRADLQRHGDACLVSRWTGVAALGPCKARRPCALVRLPSHAPEPVYLNRSSSGFGVNEAQALCSSLGFFGVARAERGRFMVSPDPWLVSGRFCCGHPLRTACLPASLLPCADSPTIVPSTELSDRTIRLSCLPQNHPIELSDYRAFHRT
jgi:hypothetical protein